MSTPLIRREAKLKAILFILCAAFLLVALSSAAPAAGRPGLDNGLAWLKLVDEGKYSQSWERASAYFKGAITKARWVETLKAVRKPLGKSISRKLVAHEQKKGLPGAPDGLYAIFGFDTSFEHKAKAVETLTMVQESDGAWRAVGYFIR